MENRDLGEAFWGMMRDAMMTKNPYFSPKIQEHHFRNFHPSPPSIIQLPSLDQVG